MKILIFGATGMIGQGVLRECILDPEVREVLTVGRSPAGIQDPKLREIVHADMLDYSEIESSLRGIDACFFCLGVTSSGMKEADYERLTYGFTLAAATALSRLNPGMTFIYVSGKGTDSSEKGRAMWARVKGKTENALLRLPLKAYMFRPGVIEPLDEIQSRTPSYRIFYRVITPFWPLIRWLMRNQVVTTRDIGRAMLSVARHGYPARILEAQDILLASLAA